MRSALLPTLAALAASAAPAPAVYWRTSPVSSNQTVLFAGAGFGPSPRAFACLDGPSCLSQQELPLAGASWESSLFFPYPAQCALAAPACAFALCSAGAAPPSSSSCTVTADPNAPEVIFAMPGSPLAGSGAVYTPARTGSLTLAPASDGSTVLRLFGRALAFAAGPGGGSLECIPAGQRGPAPTTVLLLHPGAPPVPASTATCYEAAFDLTAALAAAGQGPFPDATVRTPFGAFPVALALAPQPPSPPPAPTVIDVDRDAGGSVAAALLAAAAHSATGGALVRLGPRDYPQTAALTVPNGTVLQGAGAGASSLTFALPLAPALPAALTGGWRWGLQDLAVAVTAAPPRTAAVWVQPGTGSFSMLRAAIALLQVNVSNALRIEGVGWEVRDSALTQGGVCLWPPTSSSSDFLHSTTLQTQGSLDGLFKNNSLRWQCSAYDLDTSSRLVLEDNVIECTQAGKIPHGNSISLYDSENSYLGQASHASQGYFFAHNAQGRPPHNDPADWSYHESLTTDGFYPAGGWGAGVVTALAGSSVEVGQGLTGQLAAAGATALVIGGPGVGQWRTVVGRPSNTTILLAAPFDGHVAVGSSVVAIVGSVGGKLVVDNAFTWGSVVQMFGTTIGNVFAYNRLQDQNNPGQGSVVGFGLCYGGAHNPAFFTDYAYNSMSNSNGIDVTDNAAAQGQCASWPGPYVRWATIRGNTIGGLAAANPTECGAVNVRNPATSDVLVEGNTLQCPPGGSGGGVNVKAAHAVVNQ
jgi:hypothetical protein